MADQLGSPVGGGRFTRGFLGALIFDSSILADLGSVDIVSTQNEPVESLGLLPPNVSVVRRRFPARFRNTPFALLFGRTLPSVDVAYGPFYYTFPYRAQARVVTVHDLSCFDERFHPREKASKSVALLTKMAHECDAIVCSSDATLHEFRRRWPRWAHKALRIYCGVSVSGAPAPSKPRSPTPSILTVGTVEPRKNYTSLLDAYERLILEQGDATPVLTIVGQMGWMSEPVERRLSALQATGRCKLLRDVSDDQLTDAYCEATVFTYLSLCEGFGYPPFEAAHARCPMVLSSDSSVGEIWSGHAKCVDPIDVSGIVAGWKWALTLSDSERRAVIERQIERADEFTWKRCINHYIELYEELRQKSGKGFHSAVKA